MQNDYQIRSNSAERDQLLIAKKTMASFSEHASADRLLVYKVHPLDNGIINWSSKIRKIAQENGIADRVFVIDGGDLHQLMRGADGVIVVNSTTGLQSLELGVPTKSLGVAIYDIKGLTDQKNIDLFWGAPEKPDLAGCALATQR